MVNWKPIRGTKGKGRFRRYKVGKKMVEIAQKKVGNKWKKLYKYTL